MSSWDPRMNTWIWGTTFPPRGWPSLAAPDPSEQHGLHYSLRGRRMSSPTSSPALTPHSGPGSTIIRAGSHRCPSSFPRISSRRRGKPENHSQPDSEKLSGKGEARGRTQRGEVLELSHPSAGQAGGRTRRCLRGRTRGGRPKALPGSFPGSSDFQLPLRTGRGRRDSAKEGWYVFKRLLAA